MSEPGGGGRKPPRAVKPAEDPWARWRRDDSAAGAPEPARQTPSGAGGRLVGEGRSGPEGPARADARPTRRKASPISSPWNEAPGGPVKSNMGASPVAARAPSSPAPEVQGTPPAVPGERPREGVRLSKIMAERGLCSRREADAWIERGWVFVDGQRTAELGTRIDPQAEISISREAQKDQAKQVTILLNKPVGYVSGQPEPGCTPAVSLIDADSQVRTLGDPEFKPWMLRGLAPAGRLDSDSSGLLVFTQDGRVAKLLIGEDGKVEKEYLVRVSGQMAANGLSLLRHGLELDGKALRPARVKQLNEDQLHFILQEGKKRQIRRMCEGVGLKVIGLKRVRIGRVMLGDLPPGKWRFLHEGERF